jgi:hypothetical protein
LYGHRSCPGPDPGLGAANATGTPSSAGVLSMKPAAARHDAVLKIAIVCAD